MLSSPVLELISFLLGQTSAPGTPDFVAQAMKARDKAQELRRDAGKASSLARQAREAILARTGIKTDENPYLKVVDFERLLSCIVAASAQRTRPELILALWMKEASVALYTHGELTGRLAVANATDAKSMFIALNFYHALGTDIFTRYKPQSGGDNILIDDGSFAVEHAAVLDRANVDLMAVGAAREDYAQAMRANLNVTGGAGGVPFSVLPDGLYYPAMLSMAHALFEKIRTVPDPLYDEFSLSYPLSDNLTYAIYNNGRGSPRNKDQGAYAFFKVIAARGAAKGLTLDDFLLNAKATGQSWLQPRANVVRFDYYHKCFAPIFA